MSTAPETKPFAAWLATQTDRDDSIGDLARDAGNDSGFPRGQVGLDGVLEHLRRMGANAVARTAAAEAWLETGD